MNFIYDINQFSNLCNLKINSNHNHKNILKHYYFEFVDENNYKSFIDFSKKKIKNNIIFHINFIRVTKKYRGHYLGMYMMFYFFISQCNNSNYKYKITLDDIIMNDQKKSFYDHFGFKIHKITDIYGKNLKLNEISLKLLNEKIIYLLLKIQNKDIYNLRYKNKLLKKINDEIINTNCEHCLSST